MPIRTEPDSGQRPKTRRALLVALTTILVLFLIPVLVLLPVAAGKSELDFRAFGKRFMAYSSPRQPGVEMGRYKGMRSISVSVTDTGLILIMFEDENDSLADLAIRLRHSPKRTSPPVPKD